MREVRQLLTLESEQVKTLRAEQRELLDGVCGLHHSSANDITENIYLGRRQKQLRRLLEVNEELVKLTGSS